MKKEQSVKERIVRCAWELFFEKGFENTTLIDIIDAANISKGSFYYYFRSKNTLLNTLSILLDDEYRQMDESLPDGMHTWDKLMQMNYHVHTYIGKKIDYRLMANQYSSHLMDNTESNLLDKNRYYFQMVSRLVEEGQERGEIITTKSVRSIVSAYSMCERALVTEWCMSDGKIDLGEFSKEYMPMLFLAFRQN